MVQDIGTSVVASDMGHVEGPVGDHGCCCGERTHADATREYGVSRSWVTRLLARWRIEGDAAFEPR